MGCLSSARRVSILLLVKIIAVYVSSSNMGLITSRRRFTAQIILIIYAYENVNNLFLTFCYQLELL